MLPHQGVVALTVSLFSLAVTLGFLIGILGREKNHAAGRDDEH